MLAQKAQEAEEVDGPITFASEMSEGVQSTSNRRFA